ncbi:hypothetical protein V497_07454 [Pseudogymnoascus sp. VKM F-4516 (FW-969)]|nr:hypothetical protein V497_07454 [Pseudogymnoascus sp. VKM F-4516 (FW-969)]
MPSSSPSPDSDDGSDEDVYVVKRILAEGGTDEDRLFLIEWEGYPVEESTWEPEANVLSKDTLKAWQEEKLRQREGLSKPLDTDEFDKVQEEYARRKRRREKLGLPQQSKLAGSDYNKDSSSDEAEEGYLEVQDYEGIPPPKKSRQTRVKRHGSTPRDDDTVMNDASDSSEAPFTDRRQVPKPTKEHSMREDRHIKDARPTKIGVERNNNVHKAPVIETPSATGYQGTANRGPTLHSAIAPKGQSQRGRPRTTGLSGRMAISKPRAPRTIENRILTETRSKEPKAPQLFATKSMERKFELGARALADRPPAQLPRLINPAEYAGQGRIRKRGSAPVSAGSQSSPTPVPASGVAENSQTPVSAPFDEQSVLGSIVPTAPMVSSPVELLPEQESATDEIWKDFTGQKPEKLQRPSHPRKVSFALEETHGDRSEQTSPKAPSSERSPVATFHASPAPMGSTSDTPIHNRPTNAEVQDPVASLPSAPVRKVSLANYSAKQNCVAPMPTSMFQTQDGLGGTTLKSFLGDRQAQDDPIMLTFIDVNVHSMIWGSALQQLQIKGPAFKHICRSTDIDNLKSELNPTLLARGMVTVATGAEKKDQDTISALADYLRVNISGLLYNFDSLNIVIYPTRCEEWKFIEYSIQLQHSGELSFFSFTAPSKIVCDSYNNEAESRMSKMKIEGYENYHLVNEAIFGLSYKVLHQVNKKSTRDFFFLLFPNMAAPIAEHIVAWLQQSNKECRIYTCQQAGAWQQFLGYTANAPEAGSLIIHQTMISLIPRYPKLQKFLFNGLNNVWCVNESFPRGRFFSRLFPQGGTVCLTPGFLSGEPKMALFFLNWFVKNKKASTGTWKLFVCHGVYEFVQNQALRAADRRNELLDSLLSGLTDSEKDILAANKGLSMKHCQDRFDLMNVVGDLIRPKNERERDLDAVIQPDKAHSLLVFADESIKSSDDRGLLGYFAYWSVTHLNRFRKFIAIASNTNPEEHEAVGGTTQATETSKPSTTKSPSDKKSQDQPSSKSPKRSRWNHSAFASVDGANDDHEAESTQTGEQENEHEADDLDPEEPDDDEIDVSIDPELLRFILGTGASRKEAEEFMGRAKGNYDLAAKLYNIYEKNRDKSEGQGKGASPITAKTLPAPLSPVATKSDIPIQTTEDVTMEDAPPVISEVVAPDPPPADASTTAQNNDTDVQLSQASNAGIVTSETGSRFVPRSIRVSGTVRNELNIRPGYIPPEDKEVYKVRRDGSASQGTASVSRSRSGSRGAEDGEVKSAAASVSPGGVLTPVTPMTPGQRRGDPMEGVDGPQESEKVGKSSTLEWYSEKKLKGEEWNHISVVGWKEAFKLLRVE